MTPDEVPADLTAKALATLSARGVWVTEDEVSQALASVIHEIRAAALDDASMMFRSKTTARQRLRDEAAHERAQDTP